jgi:hypothetical protein
MAKKKDIPLVVHEILEPFVLKKGKHFTIDYNSNALLKFVDTEIGSDFYFEINKFEGDVITLIIKPSDKSTINGSSISINSKNLGPYFNNWITILEQYEKVKSVFDDPILKSFENEYFAEFEILEDEKEKPLKNNQILLLDEYLEHLCLGLEKHKTELNKTKIEEIQFEINLLQENLTCQNKLEIAEKFSKILAKIKKLGTKFLKEFITEGKKQIISKGIKFLIEQGPNIIEELGKHH